MMRLCITTYTGAQALQRGSIAAALNVLDELMSALYVANPKVYNGVMRKLERLQDE